MLLITLNEEMESGMKSKGQDSDLKNTAALSAGKRPYGLSRTKACDREGRGF